MVNGNGDVQRTYKMLSIFSIFSQFNCDHWNDDKHPTLFHIHTAKVCVGKEREAKIHKSQNFMRKQKIIWKFNIRLCSIRCDMNQNAFSSLKRLMIHEELGAEHWRWLCHCCFRWHGQRKIIMKLLIPRMHDWNEWKKCQMKYVRSRLISLLKVQGCKIQFSRSKNNFVLHFVIWLRNDIVSEVVRCQKWINSSKK